jgi:hypothetical protein
LAAGAGVEDVVKAMVSLCGAARGERLIGCGGSWHRTGNVVT